MKKTILVIAAVAIIASLAACGNDASSTTLSDRDTSEHEAPSEVIIDKTVDSVLAFDMTENDYVCYIVKAYNSSKEVVWEYNAEKAQNSIDVSDFNYCKNINTGQVVVFFKGRLTALDLKTGDEMWRAGIEARSCEMAAVENTIYVYIPHDDITYLFDSAGVLMKSIEGDEIPRNFDRPYEGFFIGQTETTETPEETKKNVNNSSESGSDYKEAYKKVLKHFEKQIGSGEGWDDPRTEYTLYDLNADGIPELIVGFGSRDKTSSYYFYTYKDGKAKLISGSTDVYDEDDEDAVDGREELLGARDRGIIGFMSMKGYEWATLYSMSGSKLTEKELFDGEMAGGENDYDFRDLTLYDFDDMSGFDWSGNPDYDNYKAMENLIKLHDKD